MSQNSEYGARWAFMFNARKAHFFPAGEVRSACGRWAFTGEGTRNQTMGDEPGPDDCKACWRKAKKAKEAKA